MSLPAPLIVDAEKRFGAFRLSARFESAGNVTALFGRSGSGKTTLVNLIAGLARPDRGAIRLGDTVLFDSTRHVDLPAHRRAIGYVFQEGRLFPHLSVRSNLLYGPRFGGRRPAEGKLAEVAALLDIAPLLARRPADLSGGEKQRVAIGRALLSEPRLLLMDEPLAALDAHRRAEVLPYVERLRDEARLPIVYVSHAVEEVATIADTLVLLAGGDTVAVGSVNAVFGRLDLRHHTGAFEASTVLSARIVSSDAAEGVTTLDHPAGRLTVPLQPGAPGKAVRLRVRARDVALAVGEPGRLSIRNRLAATVAEIGAPDGQAVDVRLEVAGDTLVARVTRGAVAALDLKVGAPVTALVKATAFDTAD
jgi:molybdate transport system ATP-binding protein